MIIMGCQFREPLLTDDRYVLDEQFSSVQHFPVEDPGGLSLGVETGHWVNIQIDLSSTNWSIYSRMMQECSKREETGSDATTDKGNILSAGYEWHL